MKIDQIIRSHRKTIALVVTPDGRLVVRAPLLAPRLLIDAFVAEKSSWIQARQAEALAHARRVNKKFEEGETFYYLGQAFPLHIIPKSKPPLTFRDGAFWLSASARQQAAALFEAYFKQQARAYISARVAYQAARLRLKPAGIRITSARTRWGSCSASDNLNFTWRLVMAPPEVIDYVVVHELIHLTVKNHSRAFWLRVASAYPAYQTARQWLKHNGAALNIENDQC